VCVVVDVIIYSIGGPEAVWMEQSLAAEQISALNPLMVMIIIPLLNVAVYRPLEKFGITVRPLQKMTLGMFLAAAAFAVAAFLQLAIEAAGRNEVHVLWQIAQYIVMTTSEVLVSVTGLEFAYTQAPRSMKSTMMGFWLLCVTFGNVLVAFLAPMEQILELSEFFFVFTGLMALAAVIFAVLAFFYKGKTYLQAAR
jgi:proton-dependent oligopeptide transporter, POT family